MKKTKIIASLGPSSSDQKTIIEMARNGVDVFRINLSHATFSECDEYIKKIHNAEEKTKRILGIMLDIDGPSIRLDALKEGEDIIQEIRDGNYDNIANLVNIGDKILLSNGEVKLEVKEINNDNFLCKILEGGIIKSNQTVYIENNKTNLPSISKKDYENIMYAIKNNVDFLALSFVRDEQDVLAVVDILIENGNESISLISKI